VRWKLESLRLDPHPIHPQRFQSELIPVSPEPPTGIYAGCGPRDVEELRKSVGKPAVD
jgi:hypothetical protein